MNIFAKISIILLGILGIFGITLLFAVILAFPVMWLWNAYLVGLVVGINPITSFWQALGIMLLCSLLFKSSSSSK